MNDQQMSVTSPMISFDGKIEGTWSHESVAETHGSCLEFMGDCRDDMGLVAFVLWDGVVEPGWEPMVQHDVLKGRTSWQHKRAVSGHHKLKIQIDTNKVNPHAKVDNVHDNAPDAQRWSTFAPP